MARWFGLTMVVAMVAALLAATACSRQPGYNAYGRYPGASPSGSSNEVYDRLKDKDDWYKDRGY